MDLKSLITSLTELLKEFLAKKPEAVKPTDPVETQPKEGATGEYKLAKARITPGLVLEEKMIDFLLAKLEPNGLFVDAVKKKDARTIFRLAGQVCVGIREQGGNNKGPMVELMQETIGEASAEAWCMAFVQTCIAFAEYCTGVNSPLYVSEHCMTTWRKTPLGQRVDKLPAAGAIAIWNHAGGDAGHTGIVDSCDGTNFKAFEGNTESGVNPSGTVVRDGGGVYHTKRSLKGAGSMRLVGFLKPF